MSADQVIAALRQLGLIGDGDTPTPEALTGGVSSDIWKIETSHGPVCVKRALAQLRTEQEWFAPVSRNASEAAWMRIAATIVPTAVPALIAEDPSEGLFAMAYLDPLQFPVWKTLLRDGSVKDDDAAAVGDALGRIHAATAGDAQIAERFATDDVFFAIRIEPYLLRTAAAHPDLADVLQLLAETTAATRRTLVHGDVSPKNILIGPDGPVFLDAECAWYGDPAFDLAFCLNHLLLKCIWQPQWSDRYLNAFGALTGAYLAHVDWEPAATLETRTAALLPGLLLARIDGTSPVEYITTDNDRDRVRRAARAGLVRQPSTLDAVRDTFRKEAIS